MVPKTTTGSSDPDRIDREIMTDNQLYALQAATIGIASGGVAAEAALILLTACLSNPVGCMGFAGGAAEIGLGQGAPLPSSVTATFASPVSRVSSLKGVTGEFIGEGTTARVFASGSNGAMKLFKGGILEDEMVYEVATMERFGGGLFPGVRRVLVNDEGRLAGYEMDRIRRGVKLNSFKGIIPETVADDAAIELEALKNRGFWHGDIYPRNIMVEVADDGAASRLRLVDPYQGNNYHVRSSYDYDEVAYLRDVVSRHNTRQAAIRLAHQ